MVLWKEPFALSVLAMSNNKGLSFSTIKIVPQSMPVLALGLGCHDVASPKTLERWAENVYEIPDAQPVIGRVAF